MNPFNPEAGSTPAPSDPGDVAVVEQSARVMWRAFPYFAWRYGERGRAFGRSDAGFLVTLNALDERAARAQVDWLVGVLAPRGMPSLLLEVQLESLGRAAARRRRPGADRLRALAAALREPRVQALGDAVAAECERNTWAAARGARQRRGAGRLIASAVADAMVGRGEHDGALVQWLIGAAPAEPSWAAACSEARRLARAQGVPAGRR